MSATATELVGENASGSTAGTGRPGGRRTLRRRLVLGTVLVVVLALLGTGIWALDYVHTYRPLYAGGFGYSPTGDLATITDGVSDTNIIETGPPGAKGYLAFAIQDSGSHPVTITPSTTFDFFPPGSVAFSWLPAPNPDRPPPNDRTGARRFPASIGAHSAILVFLETIRPHCHRGEVGGGLYQLNFSWQALGVHHNWVVPLGQPGQASLPILSCYPAAALHHIDRNGIDA